MNSNTSCGMMRTISRYTRQIAFVTGFLNVMTTPSKIPRTMDNATEIRLIFSVTHMPPSNRVKFVPLNNTSKPRSVTKACISQPPFDNRADDRHRQEHDQIKDDDQKQTLDRRTAHGDPVLCREHQLQDGDTGKDARLFQKEDQIRDEGGHGVGHRLRQNDVEHCLPARHAEAERGFHLDRVDRLDAGTEGLGHIGAAQQSQADDAAGQLVCHDPEKLRDAVVDEK